MIPTSVRIFVCTQPLDMRRSFDGLAAAAKQVIGEDPRSGALFVFTNGARTASRCCGGTRTATACCSSGYTSRCSATVPEWPFRQVGTRRWARSPAPGTRSGEPVGACRSCLRRRVQRARAGWLGRWLLHPFSKPSSRMGPVWGLEGSRNRSEPAFGSAQPNCRGWVGGSEGGSGSPRSRR